MLPIDDGKSICVIYFKPLTVAVISQLTTALLKVGCIRTGVHIVHQTDVTKKNLGASILLFLFLKAKFSVTSIQSILQPKTEAPEH